MQPVEADHLHRLASLLMTPHLEHLEDRLVPDAHGFQVEAIQAPSWVNSWTAVSVDVNAALFASQSQPITPHTLIQLNVTPQQWYAMTGSALTTARTVVPVAGGQVGVMVVPEAPGMGVGEDWEESCFQQGWWYEDPPGVTDHSQIPPGPQYGQSFVPPNFTEADLLLAEGKPYWWVFA